MVGSVGGKRRPGELGCEHLAARLRKRLLPDSWKEWFAGLPKPEASPAVDPLRLAAWSAFGLLLLAVIALMYFAQVVVVPAVAAAVTAIIFSPAMRWLERFLPSSLAALMIMIGFVVALAGIGAALVPAARDLESQLPQMASRVELRVDAVRTSLRSLQEAKEKFDRATQIGADPNRPKVQVSTDSGGGVGVFIFQGGFFIVLTYFLLVARVDFRRRLILSRETTTQRLMAARILRDIGKRVSSYLFTVSIINAGLGIITGAALWLIGMPFALLLGFAIALLNFLPIIGPILVMLATLLLSVATFADWTTILLAPGIVLVLHLIESQIVSPWLVGRQLEISPMAVFVAIAVLGWMWGAVGAMVAVPLLILLYTFGQRIPALSPLMSMIGPIEGEFDEEKEQEKAEREAAAASTPLERAKALPP